MNTDYAYDLIEKLRTIFDIVRLVDTEQMDVCVLQKDGTMVREPYKCYRVWGKNERCGNCISKKVCSNKNRDEKIELANQEIYHVISKYVEIEGEGFALEMVTKTTDEFAFLNRTKAVAILNVDDFEKITDAYGHDFGEEVVRAVSEAVRSSVRDSDSLIRYARDEISFVFQGMEKNQFQQRLYTIRRKIHAISFSDKPNLMITASIGGYLSEDGNEDHFGEASKNLALAKEKKDTIIV